MLCFNVTAGIGVLGVAKTMLSEIFGSSLPSVVDDAFAATYVLMTSVFNMLGRFFWASASDYLGRRRTYAIFFGLGALLYLTIPWTAYQVSVTPAIIWLVELLRGDDADLHHVRRRVCHDSGLPGRLFGTRYVGAIHGRLLTAWSTAGVLGPLAITSLREHAVGQAIGSGPAFRHRPSRPSSARRWPSYRIARARRPSRLPSCWRWRRREPPTVLHAVQLHDVLMAGLLVVAFVANA